ncbi:hypothetical protein AB1K70_17590 [Bremerella sp. JC770]|uniref:hypothetical protein n=1 Tax=Bremerella sp. JC770 TaxID=3232137 RepID=UPI003458BDF0
MNEENEPGLSELPERRSGRRRIWYEAYVLAAVVMIAGFIDYQRYHWQINRAMAIVGELEGRAGSLLDWPFGREYMIVFQRPLDGSELERLKAINTLQGRHYVTVVFRCQLTQKQFEAAKLALPDCVVRQADD